MNKKRTSFIQKLLLIGIYQCIFVGLAMVLLKRVGAFGCFDDCFNFGAGHFMLQGKELYSQIFFNHQPFMAYISAAVQYISHPQSLFELIKYHRIAALLFANIFGTFLILRFGFPVFITLILFEATKFYAFGDRFLAEGSIVYPMMYLALLIWNKSVGRSVHAWEYGLVAFSSWFIFWMREPFMPWSVVALGIVFFIGYKEKKFRKTILYGSIIYGVLHGVVLMILPMKEFIFNVIQTNMLHEVSVQPWTVLTIAHIVLYPVFVLFGGMGSIFQNTVWMVSLLFIVGIGYEVTVRRRYGLVGLMLVLLALANLRVVPIGTVYYDAFHMVPWYGLCILFVTLCIDDMGSQNKTRNIAIGMYGLLGLLFLYGLLSPASFIRERSNTELEFNNNYANYYSKGKVIQLLAKPGDTMFVEMWEDPIYFVAGVPTAYSYSWYTSIMPFFSKYQIAREEMFKYNPPTFYAGACRDGEEDSFALSEENKDKYIQLLNSGRPSCVYVRKDAVSTINKEFSDRINMYGYTFP